MPVAYVVVHSENGDVIGSYATMGEAADRLYVLIQADPDLRDELGVRTFNEGYPNAQQARWDKFEAALAAREDD